MLEKTELKLVERLPDKVFPSGQRAKRWSIECYCGTVFSAEIRGIRNGKQKDCGHVRRLHNPANPLFSEEDKDLYDISWHNQPAGYAVISGDNHRSTFAHRVVLERKIGRKLQKGELTDHINRDKNDNRRNNLRVADKSLNTINRDIRPDNTTGYVGVYKHHPKQYQDRGWKPNWSAQIYRNGQAKVIGYYKTPELAHEAREEYLNVHENQNC